MTHKNPSIFPVLAAIVMIPQCLFWWLAPMAAAARLAVYIGGTILTVGIPVAYLITYWNSNLRKATGLSIVCCILETTVVALSALLLGINVSVRSAIFAFIITTLVCLIALIPMINAALRQQRQGVYSTAVPSESISQRAHDIQNHDDCSPGDQSHSAIPTRIPRQVPTNKPLPPRNR